MLSMLRENNIEQGIHSKCSEEAVEIADLINPIPTIVGCSTLDRTSKTGYKSRSAEENSTRKLRPYGEEVPFPLARLL